MRATGVGWPVCCLVTAGCTAGAGTFQPAGKLAGDDPAAVRAAPEPGGAAAALAGYRRFRAVVEAALAGDDASMIDEVADGAVAAALRRDVALQTADGIVRRGHTALAPTARLLPDGRALVVDCPVSTGLWTYRRATGRRVGGPAGPRRGRFTALLALRGGTWRVLATDLSPGGCRE